MFVAADLIRPLDAGGGGSPSRQGIAETVGLREGMKIEARYRGKSKYYPGIIKRENNDGSFDIDYADVRSCTNSVDLNF